MTVPPFAMAELGPCFALLGGFLADMDGEGEDEEAAPFVCMPVGNRFVFGCGGSTGGGIGVVLGAIALCATQRLRSALPARPRDQMQKRVQVQVRMGDADANADADADVDAAYSNATDERDLVAFVRGICRAGRLKGCASGRRRWKSFG